MLKLDICENCCRLSFRVKSQHNSIWWGCDLYRIWVNKYEDIPDNCPMRLEHMMVNQQSD